METSKKFHLKWNDFQSNFCLALTEFRENKDFFDVTLACDDNQIQAHKVILSSCSPFFRDVFRRHPHQHPLLYLKGVKYQDLLPILDFMYMGEVNVKQEYLNSFLALAEDLKVTGLTEHSWEKTKKINKEKTNTHDKEGLKSPHLKIQGQNDASKTPKQKLLKKKNNQDKQEVESVNIEQKGNKLEFRQHQENKQQYNQDENEVDTTNLQQTIVNIPEELNTDQRRTTGLTTNSTNIEKNVLNRGSDSKDSITEVPHLAIDVNSVQNLAITTQKAGSLIRMFRDAWQCGICSKICSSRKTTATHLMEVHSLPHKDDSPDNNKVIGKSEVTQYQYEDMEENKNIKKTLFESKENKTLKQEAADEVEENALLDADYRNDSMIDLHNDLISNQVDRSKGIQPLAISSQKPGELIQMFRDAWQCGICNKMCSSRKTAGAHLKDVHQINNVK